MRSVYRVAIALFALAIPIAASFGQGVESADDGTLEQRLSTRWWPGDIAELMSAKAIVREFEGEDLAERLRAFALDSEASRQVRVNAVTTLAAVGTARAAEALRQIIEALLKHSTTDTEHQLASSAILCLGYYADAESASFVANLIRDTFSESASSHSRPKTDSDTSWRDNLSVYAHQAYAQMATDEAVAYFSKRSNLPEDMQINFDWLKALCVRSRAAKE